MTDFWNDPKNWSVFAKGLAKGMENAAEEAAYDADAHRRLRDRWFRAAEVSDVATKRVSALQGKVIKAINSGDFELADDLSARVRVALRFHQMTNRNLNKAMSDHADMLLQKLPARSH